jgi:hypothetical protein
MLPWIMLGASILANRKAKQQAKQDLISNIKMQHAQDLGANVGPIQAMQQKRAIDNEPLVNPGLLMNAIGSSTGGDTLDDRLAKEMAKRGLMRGYEPF